MLIKDKLKAIINEPEDEDMSKGNIVRSNKDVVIDPRKVKVSKLNVFKAKKNPYDVDAAMQAPHFDEIDEPIVEPQGTLKRTYTSLPNFNMPAANSTSRTDETGVKRSQREVDIHN